MPPPTTHPRIDQPGAWGEGRDNSRVGPGYLRAVALAGETVLAHVSTGARSGRGALYRRPLMGRTVAFERCWNGLPEWFAGNLDTHCLAAAGSTVPLGTDDGVVFLSRNEGRHWKILAEGLPAVACVAAS